MIVCHCGCVSKKEILDALRSKGAKTSSDVKRITGACDGCHGCEDFVDDIVDMELKCVK
jgi:NAD(P)H-nitrite reductase large subunit